MFTLAHLSDIHLPLMRRPRMLELLGKRASGYFNLVRRRGANHQTWALQTVADGIAAAQPDHVALTGDLINISLHDEFPYALTWLEQFGPPEWISLVPGNHDAYVQLADEPGLDLWQAYMRGDNPAPAPNDPLHWPYLRRRKDLALIGVSTAIVTAPLLATGRVGEAQLARLEEMLVATGTQGLCRVVLIHHPPEPVPAKRHKRLTDAPALAATIRRAGAELILHGHNHTDTLAFTPGADAPVPIVGVPSASAIGLDGRPAAQFNLFRIARRDGRFMIEQAAHRLDPQHRQTSEIYRRRLDPGREIADRSRYIPEIQGAL